MANEKILEMFAFVAIDETDNSEGIIAGMTGSGWMPFVGADMARVQSLLPVAKEICEKSNKKFRIIKFTDRQDITDQVK